MTKDKLEEKQIWIYAVTVLLASGIGLMWDKGSSLSNFIDPVIGILLYSMFCQIPFLKLKKVFKNLKFFKALLIGNFMIIPFLVWILSSLFLKDSVLMLGVFLVLLTPCIDYVIVFTHLGKGDSESILAASPVLFILQMLLLPVYLLLFMGEESLSIIELSLFLKAFLFLIIIPFVLALITQVSGKDKSSGKSLLNLSGWLPIPFMALTLFIVIISQIPLVANNPQQIAAVLPVYLLFSVCAPFAGIISSKIFRLNEIGTRTVAFSTSTRNSLVVLPLAQSLPDSSSAIAAAVIVTQTLVELVFELIYIKTIPMMISSKKKQTLS